MLLDYPTIGFGRSVASRFFYLEMSPKGSSLERLPTL